MLLRGSHNVGEEHRHGQTALAANEKTFITVGSALMLTTVVMTAGLGTVMTSQLPPHVSFAVMACTTLVVALPADLLFLPALLTLFPGKRPETAQIISEAKVPADT